MRYIAFDLLIKVLNEQGIDNVYEKLYAVFLEEPIYIIDRCGNVVYMPIDIYDLWDYLEGLYLNACNTSDNTIEEV